LDGRSHGVNAEDEAGGLDDGNGPVRGIRAIRRRTKREEVQSADNAVEEALYVIANLRRHLLDEHDLRRAAPSHHRGARRHPSRRRSAHGG
jgi:hypothetical protein